MRETESSVGIGRRSSSKIRLGRSILIAAALVATAGSSVAMAVRSTPRRTPTIGPQSFGKAVARCHRGSTAVSGGFASPEFELGSTVSTVGRLGSERVGKRRIETRGFNFGNAAGHLVSFAYCARNDHGLQVRSASTSVEPNAVGSAIARCPRGTEAVGGGFGTRRFFQDQGPRIITLTSKRLGERSWKVVGFNIGSDSGRPGTLIAHAYCEAAPFRIVIRSKQAKPPPGALKTFDVRCPPGTRALAGGFDGHVQLQDGQARAVAAVTSKRASGGRAWRTSALRTFDANRGSVTAYAYCRRR
jgi:hypothetical protein